MDLKFINITSGINIVIGSNSRHLFPMHTHKTFCIGLVLQGQRQIKFKEEKVEVNPGEGYLVNASEPHQCKDNGLTKSISICFNPTQISKDINIPEDKRFFFKKKHICDNKLFSLIDKNCWAKSASIEKSLKLFIKKTINSYAELVPALFKKQPLYIKSSEEYMNNNFRDMIFLEELSEKTKISYCFLNRQFKKFIGLPPHKYQKQLRIKLACNLIKEKKLTLSDIAQEVGFYDQSHFYRIFKQLVGITPKKFQKSNTSI